jgi:hypothetical protein
MVINLEAAKWGTLRGDGRRNMSERRPHINIH